MKTKINNFLNDGFEKKLFNSSIYNLEDKNNKLRLNNFAYSMRELTRHILERFSPDKEILKCSWYKNETNKENGISRKQRSIYAIQGGLTNDYILNELEIDLDYIHKNLISSINKLSKFTHIGKETFDISNDEIDKQSQKVLNDILNFLEMIITCRTEIIEKLQEHINLELVNTIFSETIQDLDMLSTHHFIEDCQIDDIKITNIDSSKIYFKVSGSLYCQFQYGSNSDLKRDDGYITSKTAPFECNLFTYIDNLENIICVPENISSSITIDDIFN